MISVNYSLEFNYRNYQDIPFPALTVGVRNPVNGESVEHDAFLDSGAVRSVFFGTIPETLGLNILDGEEWTFHTNAGHSIEARILPIQIVLTEDGIQSVFNLPLAFSMVDLQRNLLGRDFFDRIQVGFRESQSRFFIEPTA
jgi:hypothetical protein